MYGGDALNLGFTKHDSRGAVERNRVKRLLREAFARAEPGLAGGQDIVVVARPPARELAERAGLSGIDAALTELLERARLRAGGGAGEVVGDGAAEASEAAEGGREA